MESLDLEEIAEAYVLGSREYKESENIKKEVDQINIELYQYINGKKIDSKNISFYEKGKSLSLKHFKEITKKLGSNFDDLIFESEAEKVGKELVKNNIGEVFQKSQGAVVFEGKNFTNVFINSQGFGTYLAKDIGLLKLKKEKYSNLNNSLVITDIEQKQHFEMVKEAGEKLGEIKDFVQKSKYIQHGRMNFSGNQKISSRYGNVPLATDVLKKVQKNILEKMRDRDFTENEKKDISEKLAIATIKYSILKVRSGKNISFDLEKDLNPQGDTGTFLMYSLVRAKSIFNKMSIPDIKTNISEKVNKEYKFPSLVIKFFRFPEAQKKAVENYSPHYLANYLYGLAKEFNNFYAGKKILDNSNESKEIDFYILKTFIEIVEKTFELLAIKTVDKM